MLFAPALTIYIRTGETPVKQEELVEMSNVNDLPHINDVRPLDASDLPCIEDLRQVLIKHGAIDRFGITLLHKHFDIECDEILMESTDEARKEQIIRPQKKADLTGCLAQTAWRLSDHSAVLGCYMSCVWASDGWYRAHVTAGS